MEELIHLRFTLREVFKEFANGNDSDFDLYVGKFLHLGKRFGGLQTLNISRFGDNEMIPGVQKPKGLVRDCRTEDSRIL